jgi:uncharacterized membrane protein
VRRHISAVAVGVAPLLAGAISNATRPAAEPRLPLSWLVAAGAILFLLAEVIGRGPERDERVLAAVAVAAIAGVVGGALLAFAVVGVMLGASHGDPKVIEGSGSLGLAVIRQWWIFSAVVFVITLVAAARVFLAGDPK